MRSGANRSPKTPSGVVEVLRLLVVAFFAGVGYEAARAVGDSHNVLGPFNGAAIGIIVGSGLGYVLGGVLGRTAISAVSRTEEALRGVSAEHLVAGVFGGMLGVAVGAGLAWPVFLVLKPLFALPLFGFAVAVVGLLGYRLGSARRDDMLRIFAIRAGLRPKTVPTAALPRLLDTSVAIDGRIVDVVRAGFLHGTLLVPTAVLGELQALADAADDLRRAKGRRGLQTLETLAHEPDVDIQILEDDLPTVPDVDAKLVRLALDGDYALLTLDTNLARVAALAGVHVMNLHALALALRPPVVAGEDVVVHLLRPGKEPGQAVGYLDDGTMVVAERCRDRIGQEVTVRVTSVLTTANGRMVFGHPASHSPNGALHATDSQSAAIRDGVT